MNAGRYVAATNACGGLMSKYREAFLIWLTVVTAICGTVVVIHYTSESCHAREVSEHIGGVKE
jgi:hypothetical protein